MTREPSLMRRIAKLWLPPIIQDGLRALRKKPAVNAEGFHEFECLGLRWRLEMQSSIAKSMLATGVWERETTDLVLDFVKPEMRGLSVGANFGYYALLMAQRVGPTGRVWAFEPTKHYRDQLNWHLNANGFSDRVTVVPFGLSDKAEEAAIEISPQSASMHFPPTEKLTGRERIELVALDSIAAGLGIDRVDFVSLDIDGHEPAFFRGARATLTRNLPPIAMEFSQECLYSAGSDARQLAATLQGMGYKICSESTRTPFPNELAFLKECGNYRIHSNALALRNDAVS
jgi:FkbM family methyltransferase